MWLYFIPPIVLFILSRLKPSKQVLIVCSCILMLFICFGYMTGSDWRNYEYDYENGFTSRLVEPGYMLINNSFAAIGVNFWVFHIFFKCLSYIAILFLINKLADGRKFYFAIMLWYASFGLFMFINCPFRNVIACGIAAIAFCYLLKKKMMKYYICSLLSLSFHFSGLLLLLVPLLKFDKIKSSILVSGYVVLMVLLSLGGIEVLTSTMSRLFPGLFYSRIDYYLDTVENGGGSILSLGSIPRLLCLFFLIKFRHKFIEDRMGSFFFNMAYFYLLICLIYYVFPMLFRLSLVFAPFYVTVIAKGVSFLKVKGTRLLAKYAFFLISLAITYTTVTKTTNYVPYTNIIHNFMIGELYEYAYRDQYNPSISPFK